MILPYLNFKTVSSYKTSFLDLYSLQNFETIISCRKLTSKFSLSHATKCHALDLPDVGFDLGGGNAQETKKNKQTNKQASKKQSNKNKAIRTLKTCGPKDRLPSTVAYKPWVIQLCKGLINTMFCVSLTQRYSTTVSLVTNSLVCQVTVGCAIFLCLLTVEENELGFA